MVSSFQQYAETAFILKNRRIIGHNSYIFSNNNIFNRKMKTQKTLKSNDLLAKVEQAVRESLAQVPFVELVRIEHEGRPNGPQARVQFDLLMTVRTPAGTTNLALATKGSGEPRVARAALDQLGRVLPALEPPAYGVLAAPYISLSTAALCVERNFGYVDLAGNCRLAFWPVFISREGAPNPFARRQGIVSLFQASSFKTLAVLRALLAWPKRRWRTVDLASEAGVSLGLVSSVKQLLEDREWLVSTRDGFVLTEPCSLLTDWAVNYELDEVATKGFYTSKPLPQLEAELTSVASRLGVKYALTGLAGAFRLAPAARYQRVSLYVATGQEEELATALGLRPVPDGANVEFLTSPDPGVFHYSALVGGTWIASPVQLYLDLRATKARGEEAAEALLRQVIEPQWR